ncbi:MAG TPA: hypothetical protein VF590_05275, partial [Isosphaeraceae bacterium]
MPHIASALFNTERLQQRFLVGSNHWVHGGSGFLEAIGVCEEGVSLRDQRTFGSEDLVNVNQP